MYSLLLAGLVTSLIAIGLGPVVPGLVRGITLAMLVAGLVWSASTQRARVPVAWWPLLVITVGVLPGLLAIDVAWPFRMGQFPASFGRPAVYVAFAHSYHFF